MPLGGWFLHSAEPDIHLLSQAPESRHRRLSLCSLPVPKQFEESLGSRLRRPAGDLRDLAACASIDPDVLVFPFFGRVFTLPRFVGTRPQARNPCCVFLQPASSPPSSWPRRAWPDCRCLAAVLFRRAVPVPRCSAVPVGPLRPAPAGYACSSASRSVSASPCRLSSSRR